MAENIPKAGAPKALLEDQDSRPPAATSASPLAMWMDRVERLHRNLRREIGDNPQDYADRICLEFFQHRDKDLVMESVVRLGKLQTKIYRYSDRVYSLEGVGPEYERAAQVSTEVCLVTGWVEEILCLAMVDFESAEAQYARKAFGFQCKQ
ncbi:hypothetical protein BDN70DRAFT_895298 [Pholiota conissans]|uniref:Uncharacterized protein n=1 Tax=Pholiota conissans TaxID=109636 RepID=A0A9P6D052_9AGAR|nr:hypothetical protein BDN70DRAFT_895298 [Pholiota conissans]